MKEKDVRLFASLLLTVGWIAFLFKAFSFPVDSVDHWKAFATAASCGWCARVIYSKSWDEA